MIVNALKGRCRTSIKDAILCKAWTLNTLIMVKAPTVYAILYPCSMNILTNIKSSNLWAVFPFICIFFDFFLNNVLQLLVYKLFNFLIKFIPKYFIFSEASVNGIFFPLIFLWIGPGLCIGIQLMFHFVSCKNLITRSVFVLVFSWSHQGLSYFLF